MILTENQDKSIVLVKPENLSEASFLEDFPGCLRQQGVFFLPSKQNVVGNVYQRLITDPKVKVRYTPFVRDLVESRSSLLELPESFTYHTAPLKHQDVALKYAYTYNNILLGLAPGLGKTKIVLDYIFLKGFDLSIIVCPKALMFVWVEEVAKHRPELIPYDFKTTNGKIEIAAAKEIGANLIVLNYAKAVICLEELKALKADFLLLDEALIKDYTTDRTKALTELSKTVKHRGLASGTLINNSPLDCFAPIRFLEPSLVGTSVTRFKKEYCIEKALDRTALNGPKLVVGFRKVPEIRSILESCSVIMRKEEWLKLPPKHFHDVKVQLSDEQRRVYWDLNSNYIAELSVGSGQFIEVDIPLVALSKLSQISNGFVYKNQEVEDFEDLGVEVEVKKKEKVGGKGKKRGKRETFFFQEQPKIEALLKLLRVEVAGRRCITWFNYTAECELLEKAFAQAGVTFITIRGGEKDIGGKVREFNSNPSIRVCLCQAKSVNYGVTVMGRKENEDDFLVEPEFTTTVSDQIFYSLNFSLEVYLQQQDRIHRIGQEKECNYWRLIANTPIEERVVDAIERKLSVNVEMLIDILRRKEPQ